jgi:hypothetical protein
MGSLSLLYCERCAAPLDPPNATETLLAKLMQLARFGLSAEAAPILTHADERGDRVPARLE